ncbi:MAG: hypothetical protein LW839_07420 [Cryomorphaceae bacterium]|jgi:hypothetical protein|nr:hypothetical protein [Cryomorphaceae bacterium]
MKQLLVICLGLLLLSSKCNNQNQHPVPFVPVDITIDIQLPSYSNLQGVGGWTYLNGGSRGIIVYRKAIDEFVAFDRHAPSDPEGSCPIALYPDDQNFLQLIDSCNNAVFSLYDGSPVSNSIFGLRQYATQFNGNNLLRVYN